MEQSTRKKGSQGELAAKVYLEGKQYKILQQNWHYGRSGEIDLVALSPEKSTLVFIEVKARKNSRYGAPIEALTDKKQGQLIQLAEAFINNNPEFSLLDVRFDVISLQITSGGYHSNLTHTVNAFQS